MALPEKRIGPADNEADSKEFITADDSVTTLPFAPTQLRHPKAVAPAYVVFTFDTDGSMVRRNVYLSLHSALKAKERAEKRGRRFDMMLCELVPTPHKPLIVVGGAVG